MRKPAVAYVSPLPPARSGIADYSRELLPHLAAHLDLTLYAADPAAVAPELHAQFAIHPFAAFPAQRWDHELTLYQMGNSAQHAAMYELLRRFPGVVVLHDVVLHHFTVYRTLGQGDTAAYAREMGYSLGAAGLRRATAVARGRARPDVFAAPLNERVIDLSLGMVVHSDYVARRVERHRPALPLRTIPALVQPRDGRSRRAELGLPPDAVLFASLGQITAEKQLDRALRAFRRLRQTVPHAHYLLVGEVRPDVDLPALLQALDLADAVHPVGFAPDLQTFVDWLHTADVVINLRHPTLGETSATALRALAAARPLVVYDHGWYSEIPDAACVKIAPLDDAALYAAMQRLATSAAERRRLGAAGQRYTADHCHPAAVAAAYADFLHTLLRRLQR